jgi:hypothetical protein
MKLVTLFLQTIPFFKTLLWVYILYKFGIIKGILSIVIFIYAYNFFMQKILNLSPLTAGDLLFMWSKEDDNYTLLAIQVLDSLKIEEIKQIIIEKGIKRFRRMRSRLHYKWFDWWWREIPLEEVLSPQFNPIQIIENKKNIKFDSKEDIIKLNYELVNDKIDIMSGLPYRIIMIRNPNDKLGNIIIYKMDHSFSDGLGFMGLITTMADNYDSSLFPASFQKRFGIIDILLIIVSLPWLLVYPFYRNFISLKSGKTPFKLSKNVKKSNRPKTAVSNTYDFHLYTKINKELKITFNDLVMSAYSAAIKKYCKDHLSQCGGKMPSKIITITPIANRNFPRVPEELTIENNSSAVACDMKLIDDPYYECHVISKEFIKNVRNVPLVKMIKFLSDTTYERSPYYCARWISVESTQNFDVTFSNVPGPKHSLYYAGCKVLEMSFFSTPGLTNAFITIYTYAGHFRTSLILDESLEVDQEVLLSYLDKELSYLKERYHDSQETKKKTS